MKKAVFLDRDGVLNEVMTRRVRHVNKPSDLYLLPGVPEAVKGLKEAGFLVCVVTNQGGVGLGFMTEKTLLAVHRRLNKLLAAEGAVIDDIAYCPHRPAAGCRCRKPKPGMLLELARKHGIDLARSYMIGDSETDIGAGRAAGTRTIRIGAPDGADFAASSLLEAAVIIVRHEVETAGGQDRRSG
ncbi:HAD-IIIA family hydrolase [Paenibacillus sp. UNC499MF]|uniref:D-glycero-alpha-D-manno-heptose-1,7-bisphosphate 7-phosphatase n=1 Tax=Paenibacillus sp. UNC499MF TaxID=1502751 RepID=UPI0008A09814|nr:HAD family hydrolase [Paenibacillus sp. UNC499MF]SEG43180.1 D-glycero-D-manno-heptose 1,7-bisphosphate phosphatase [Paenibacillus sp. UNC499MF]